MKPTEDILLVNRIYQNNKEAFDELFRQYYTPLCRYALKISQTEELAEEAVQLVFINLWQKREKLTVNQSVSAYLYKAVRLKIYEIFRARQVKDKYEQEYALKHGITEEEASPELDNYELSCLIWSAIEKLPEKCAEIFRLSRDEGLTYNEIATHLNISAKTVENQMGIAFKKLREILYPTLKSKGWGTIKIDSFINILFLQGISTSLLFFKNF